MSSSARLRADFWVSAYLRRCASAGAVAVLRRRGAPEAGAIFITLDRLDGTVIVLGPAPQSEAEPDGERRFVPVHKLASLTPAEAEERLQREIRFDGDLWIVAVEDREGRSFLDAP